MIKNRPLSLLLAAGTAHVLLCANPAYAYNRLTIPARPSVEIHLDALEALRPSFQPRPSTPYTSPAPVARTESPTLVWQEGPKGQIITQTPEIEPAPAPASKPTQPKKQTVKPSPKSEQAKPNELTPDKPEPKATPTPAVVPAKRQAPLPKPTPKHVETVPQVKMPEVTQTPPAPPAPSLPPAEETPPPPPVPTPSIPDSSAPAAPESKEGWGSSVKNSVASFFGKGEEKETAPKAAPTPAPVESPAPAIIAPPTPPVIEPTPVPTLNEAPAPTIIEQPAPTPAPTEAPTPLPTPEPLPTATPEEPVAKITLPTPPALPSIPQPPAPPPPPPVAEPTPAPTPTQEAKATAPALPKLPLPQEAPPEPESTDAPNPFDTPLSAPELASIPPSRMTAAQQAEPEASTVKTAAETVQPTPSVQETEKAPQEKQVASLPAAETPSPAIHGKPDASLTFQSTETTVPLSVRPSLDAVVNTLKSDTSTRIIIVAYASGMPEQPSTARRVSLSRALAVRAYLIDQGIGNLRINVQAEGSRNAGTQPDRVELFIKAADAGAAG